MVDLITTKRNEKQNTGHLIFVCLGSHDMCLFGRVSLRAAKVTDRNAMMSTMTQTSRLNLRLGKTGRCCHGDDLLSATASHSSRLRSNWLWNKGGREVEGGGPLLKRRVNELSLLSESGPLINRPCSPSLMFARLPRERLIFFLWAAGSSLQAQNYPPELTNL